MAPAATRWAITTRSCCRCGSCAKNADKPVTLRAAINYAVCDKLCIPVEADAELAFTSVASTEDNALFAALDTVPKPANVGDPNPLTIRDVKRDGKSTVLVDVVAPPDATSVNLFVEGPTPDWGLPVPKLLEHGPPGVKRFAFELDGLPPGANPEGAALKLTLVGGEPFLRIQYQSGIAPVARCIGTSVRPGIRAPAERRCHPTKS